MLDLAIIYMYGSQYNVRKSKALFHASTAMDHDVCNVCQVEVVWYLESNGHLVTNI